MGYYRCRLHDITLCQWHHDTVECLEPGCVLGHYPEAILCSACDHVYVPRAKQNVGSLTSITVMNFNGTIELRYTHKLTDVTVCTLRSIVEVNKLIDDLRKTAYDAFATEREVKRGAGVNEVKVRYPILVVARSYSVYRNYIRERGGVIGLTPSNTSYLGNEDDLRGLEPKNTVIFIVGPLDLHPILRTGFIKEFTIRYHDDWHSENVPMKLHELFVPGEVK